MQSFENNSSMKLEYEVLEEVLEVFLDKSPRYLGRFLLKRSPRCLAECLAFEVLDNVIKQILDALLHALLHIFLNRVLFSKIFDFFDFFQ